MSYCRWSSDNFNCDVYAYESVYGGIEVNLANRRYKGEIPKVDDSLLLSFTTENKELWQAQKKAQSYYLERCGTEPLQLKEKRKDYNVDTLQELYDSFLDLIECGYRIPGYVMENIKNELKI